MTCLVCLRASCPSVGRRCLCFACNLTWHIERVVGKGPSDGMPLSRCLARQPGTRSKIDTRSRLSFSKVYLPLRTKLMFGATETCYFLALSIVKTNLTQGKRQLPSYTASRAIHLKTSNSERRSWETTKALTKCSISSLLSHHLPWWGSRQAKILLPSTTGLS